MFGTQLIKDNREVTNAAVETGPIKIVTVAVMEEVQFNNKTYSCTRDKLFRCSCVINVIIFLKLTVLGRSSCF